MKDGLIAFVDGLSQQGWPLGADGGCGVIGSNLQGEGFRVGGDLGGDRFGGGDLFLDDLLEQQQDQSRRRGRVGHSPGEEVKLPRIAQAQQRHPRNVGHGGVLRKGQVPQRLKGYPLLGVVGQRAGGQALERLVITLNHFPQPLV